VGVVHNAPPEDDEDVLPPLLELLDVLPSEQATDATAAITTPVNPAPIRLFQAMFSVSFEKVSRASCAPCS